MHMLPCVAGENDLGAETMTKTTRNRWSIRAAAPLMLAVAAGSAWAQASGTAGTASSQDTQFLQDFGKDSNFEIATSRLALARSPSEDVKHYASMVIHDHTALKVELRSADRTAGVTPVGPSSMTDEEQNTYSKLKGLRGNDFDQAYIQELVKGNDQIEQEEKSEASDSALPTVKQLAVRSGATDKKHAENAKQLAKAHNVQS